MLAEDPESARQNLSNAIDSLRSQGIIEIVNQGEQGKPYNFRFTARGRAIYDTLSIAVKAFIGPAVKVPFQQFVFSRYLNIKALNIALNKMNSADDVQKVLDIFEMLVKNKNAFDKASGTQMLPGHFSFRCINCYERVANCFKTRIKKLIANTGAQPGSGVSQQGTGENAPALPRKSSKAKVRVLFADNPASSETIGKVGEALAPILQHTASRQRLHRQNNNDENSHSARTTAAGPQRSWRCR